MKELEAFSFKRKVFGELLNFNYGKRVSRKELVTSTKAKKDF